MAKRYMRRLREGEGLREGGIEGSKAKWGSTALLGGTRWGHHRNGTRSAIAIGTCICRIAHDFESRFRVPHSPSISLTSPHLITHLTQLVTSLHTYLHTTAAPRPGCIASHHHNKRLPGRHAYIAVVSLVCPNLWAERGCLPRALPCVSPAPTTSLTLPLPTPYSSPLAAHSAHARPRLVVLSSPRPLPLPRCAPAIWL
jgi:hypothetical protein